MGGFRKPPPPYVEPLDRVVRVTYADGRVRYRVTSASGIRVLAWDWGGVVTFRFAWTARRALRRHQREQISRTVVKKEVVR